MIWLSIKHLKDFWKIDKNFNFSKNENFVFFAIFILKNSKKQEKREQNFREARLASRAPFFFRPAFAKFPDAIAKGFFFPSLTSKSW